MTDDARRDRVKDAIQYASWSKNDWYVVPDKVLADLADAAIAALHEPEPTPQLLVDMAQAIHALMFAQNATPIRDLDEARAALGVVLRNEQLACDRFDESAAVLADRHGIPESLVKELLDE